PYLTAASRVGELRGQLRAGTFAGCRRPRRAAPCDATTSHSLPREARERRKGRYAPLFVGLDEEGRAEGDVGAAEASFPRPRSGGGAAAAGHSPWPGFRLLRRATLPPHEIRHRRDGGGGERDPGEGDGEAGDDVGRVVDAQVDTAGADREDDEGGDDPRRRPEPWRWLEPRHQV